MEIEFDPVKEQTNVAVHRISLRQALVLFQGPMVEVVDGRRDYGEERIIAYGLIEGRLHVCVYTMRGERRRIISLRRANGREQRKFGNDPI